MLTAQPLLMALDDAPLILDDAPLMPLHVRSAQACTASLWRRQQRACAACGVQRPPSSRCWTWCCRTRRSTGKPGGRRPPPTRCASNAVDSAACTQGMLSSSSLAPPIYMILDDVDRDVPLAAYTPLCVRVHQHPRKHPRKHPHTWPAQDIELSGCLNLFLSRARQADMHQPDWARAIATAAHAGRARHVFVAPLFGDVAVVMPLTMCVRVATGAIDAACEAVAGCVTLLGPPEGPAADVASAAAPVNAGLQQHAPVDAGLQALIQVLHKHVGGTLAMSHIAAPSCLTSYRACHPLPQDCASWAARHEHLLAALRDGGAPELDASSMIFDPNAAPVALGTRRDVWKCRHHHHGMPPWPASTAPLFQAPTAAPQGL